MLVEHLHVVAGIFLRGECIELTADGVDRLRDVFGASRRGAFEEHVLDEMGDAAVAIGLVPRPARKPDAEADGTHVSHRFGDETNPVIECVANNHWSWQKPSANRWKRKG